MKLEGRPIKTNSPVLDHSLSLTPRFSGVISHNQNLLTVLTVSPAFRRMCVFSLSIFAFAFASTAFAGKAQKWKDLPEPVRATILANGGKADGRVDLESGKVNGKAVYEAEGKDKSSNDVDLVITEDGKLVEMKNDDPAERASTKAIKPVKALKGAKFSHPRDINNPWLPLASLKQDILEGKEGAKKVRIERVAKPDVRKTFQIGNETVEALAVEDREYENGELAEVAMDYFAQSDDGAVYYLGEEVDEYKNGKIASHEGSWMLGKDTQKPGVIIPGNPRMGDKFKSEDVSKEIHEDDQIISLSEKAQTPAGTYENCVKVREKLADGAIEYKYYAKGIGVVREQPAEGDVLLISHTTR
jgi:hypothetical protein